MQIKIHPSSSTPLFRVFYVILTLGFVFKSTNAFNLSPKANIVFNEPNFMGAKPRSRSSYFGYTINLKRNSILVSAPRAHSSLKSQRDIDEIGVIYKCPFDLNIIGNCTPFNFDSQGNILHKDTDYKNRKNYVFKNEIKDHQWLGASMDGNELDNDFVVCAPYVNSNDGNIDRIHGLCYWTTNTSSSSPANVRKIATLRFSEDQCYDSETACERPINMYGIQGSSVHITENNEEILIGAPGILGWKGSAIRYKPSRSQIDLDDDGIDYYGDVPNPNSFRAHHFSYFGYAISSGYFEKNKLLYIASAPRADARTGIGRVHIFNIVDAEKKTQNHSNRIIKTILGTNKAISSTDKTIEMYHTFTGEQYGEYFGYSLMSEDFDNDGYVDVAVGAPFNKKNNETFDSGAVYIYRNKGTASSFELHAILRTDYELDGRFGTTISKIGDINRDGYNDLLVGSPFEGNGTVYVFHGSANGLLTKPNQRIVAPQNDSPANHMFGFGLSKGVDIDGNGYLDIAIGSPNTEKVYVFKSYPVIRTYLSITPSSNEIQITTESFKFNVCWKYEKYGSESGINFDVYFNAIITVDDKHKRVSFDKDVANKYEIINKTLTSAMQCMELKAFVKFSAADIFKPIEIEMVHNVLNSILNHENDTSEVKEFCENCVAVSPNSLTKVKSRIVYSTGCTRTRCVADLVVKSFLVNVSLPYILGTTSTLFIDYSVENRGETAYLAQIRITLPNSRITFTRIPSNCELDENAVNTNILECDLNSGTPLYKNKIILLRISIATTDLNGKELTVKSKVFSTIDESNESDNSIENVIPLGEFSNIEVFGVSSNNTIKFQDSNVVDTDNLTHTFEIQNAGPSKIKSLYCLVSFPISYLNPLTSQSEQLINVSSITVENMNNKNQRFIYKWVQNDTSSVLNPIPISNMISTNEKLLKELPSNRTIFFNCTETDQEKCLHFMFSIEDFTQLSPILVTIHFMVDLKNLTKILTEERNTFVIHSSVEFVNQDERDTSTIDIVQNLPFTIISKHFAKPTPIWIYIVSIIIGILFLIVLS